MKIGAFVVFVVGAAVACGGMTTGSDAGADAADSDADGNGWTQCSSSTGYSVCGGPNDCPASPADCECNDQMDPNGLGLCSKPKWPVTDTLCVPGTDGNVCVLYFDQTYPTKYWDVMSFEVGVLLAQNGGSARVRYADLGLWTDDPIPDPTSCPDLGGAQPCGGSCGACAQAGATCVGRSPLHPVGVCDPDQSKWCSVNPSKPAYSCGASGGCFTYTVQPDAQPDADAAGICLPLDQCNALAQKLPGGGKCTPGT